MGVPKFYRWISERYPQINQVISDSTLLPEFDNLYLDMNGIIHACTHPNDNDTTAKALTFREMIQGMFAYIDRIVSEIVKPKKLLFMAIDGVAPRAKLNQQRSRRFRSAQERLEGIEQMRAKGIIVDEDNLFDSNCITPGTEFMDQVGQHIRWFIRKKIKESDLWKNLEIVFSGHSVPGEGEHKIMQFIREKRNLPSYEPNQRHCMYGQDADLIMLGLASHEPHFALLREVVNFTAFSGKNKQSQRSTVIRQTKEAQFQLLHLSILREYIEMDLGQDLMVDEPNNDGFVVDKERLIDDFILLTFFVGNDFLPHLPTLDISENAFDVIFSAYKHVLSKTHKYFVCNGEITDFDQLEVFCSIIGQQEHEILEDREENEKAYQSKQRKYNKDKKNVPNAEESADHEKSLQHAYEAAKMQSTIDKLSSVSIIQSDEDDNEELSIVQKQQHIREFVDLYFEGQEEVEEEFTVKTKKSGRKNRKADLIDENAPSLNFAAKDYRGRYYYEKFKRLPLESDNVLKCDLLRVIIKHYLEGLIWCLAYYIKGCISWTWYFPHHYGPMLQDMKRLKQIHDLIDFKLGSPFKPFQQLLGCLPPLSRKLLPMTYQWLMGSSSPVYEFYPSDFAVDMTHKRNPWEATVLLPFIDEKRLLEAELKYCPVKNFTPEEIARNSFGNVLVYSFDPSVTTTYFSSSHDIGFADIAFCQSSMREYVPSLSPGAYFKPKLIEGTNVFLPGFPTLTSVKITRIETLVTKINVFGSDSRYKTLNIEIDSLKERISALLQDDGNVDVDKTTAASIQAKNEKKFTALLGKSVFVNYPQLHEAKVVAVTTEHKEYRCSLNKETGNPENIQTIKYDAMASNKWRQNSEEEKEKYLKGRGIPGSGGLIIGDPLIRLKLVALQGMTTNVLSGERKKVFGKSEIDVPIQLVLWNHVNDPRFVEMSQMPLKSLLPHRCEVIGLRDEYIGCKGYVIHEDSSNNKPSMDADISNVSVMARPSLTMEHKDTTTPKLNDKNKRQVTVEFLLPDSEEPQFGHAILNSIKEEYYSARDICKALKINPDILGKMVGSIFIEPTGHDLGLNLKRNGQYQLLGYVRKVENNGVGGNNNQNASNVWKQIENVKLVGSNESSDPMDSVTDKVAAFWEYSDRAVSLISDYIAKFGILWNSLSRLPHKPKYSGAELLGSNYVKVTEEIMVWMKSQPFFNMPRTLLSTTSMPKEAIVAVEKAGDMRCSYMKTHPLQSKIVKNVNVNDIFRGDLFSPFDAPVNLNIEPPSLGDRIVNLTSTGVPIGLKGTVVSIHSNTGFVEIVFDEEFIGGKTLQGNCSMFRGRLCPWSGVFKIPSKQVRSTTTASTRSTISVPSQSKLSAAAASLTESKKPHEEVNLRQQEIKSHSSTQKTSQLFEIIRPQSTATKKENSTGHQTEKQIIYNAAKSQTLLSVLNAPISNVSKSNSDTLNFVLNDHSGFSIVQAESESKSTNNVPTVPIVSSKTKSQIITSILKKENSTMEATHTELSSGLDRNSTALKTILHTDQSKVNKIPVAKYKPSIKPAEKLAQECLVEPSPCEGKKTVTSTTHFVPSKLVVRKKN